MTVGMLIAKLQKMPSDALILIPVSGGNDYSVTVPESSAFTVQRGWYCEDHSDADGPAFARCKADLAVVDPEETDAPVLIKTVALVIDQYV